MANEIVTEVILDLDKLRASLKRAEEEAKKSGKSIGDNLGDGAEDGFGAGIKKIRGAFTGFAAAAAVAIAGVAAAIKAAQIAEEAERIENQFDLLTRRSGIMGAELQAALEKSADGLVDNTDLLQAANRAMIDLGQSANRLPEILTIARQATSVFGGNLVDNFEKINLAIATGNTRMLKSVGLIIDSDEAMKKFANSIGTGANALTEAGRQQAILNAILEKGRTNFEGISGDVGASTGSFQRLLVAIKNLSEEGAKAFNLFFGSAISGALKSATGLVDSFTKKIQSTFGWLSDKALRDLREGVQETGKQIQKEQDRAALIAIDKQLENRNKINQIAIQADSAALAARAQSAITLEQQQAVQDEREQQIRAEHLLKLQQLDLLASQNGLMDSQAYENARAALNEETNARIVSNNQIAIQRTRASFELLRSTMLGIISNAFQALGAALIKGGKAFEAFKNFALNAMGDWLIKMGEAMILQSKAFAALQALISNPFTAVAGSLAFGLALVALGGVLKAAAGGGGGEAAGGGVAAEGGGGLAASTTTSATQLEDVERAPPATNVTVNVQGNILDRRETGLAIADVINETFGSNGIVFATGTV